MSYASAASGGGGGAGADIDMSNMPRSAEEQRQRQEAAAQREEQIEQMLRQMCSPAALDRLKRVQLVRKDRADHVKRMLIQMAQVCRRRRVILSVSPSVPFVLPLPSPFPALTKRTPVAGTNQRESLRVDDHRPARKGRGADQGCKFCFHPAKEHAGRRRRRRRLVGRPLTRPRRGRIRRRRWV